MSKPFNLLFFIIGDISLLLTLTIKVQSGTFPQGLNILQQLKCVGVEKPYRLLWYGCHCGFENKKGKILDGLDRCCEVHDKCFRKIPTNTTKAVYFYNVKCENEENICNDDGIAQEICDCDKQFSSCAKQHQGDYTSQHIVLPFWRKDQC